MTSFSLVWSAQSSVAGDRNKGQAALMEEEYAFKACTRPYETLSNGL